mmetsp:Transcript_116122/g.322887  ORF Transcript_116122/g.322887 Transcript_116122/m.322887 type:complete len:272 (+) Transcript_116122:66-881(+)
MVPQPRANHLLGHLTIELEAAAPQTDRRESRNKGDAAPGGRGGRRRAVTTTLAATTGWTVRPTCAASTLSKGKPAPCVEATSGWKVRPTCCAARPRLFRVGGIRLAPGARARRGSLRRLLADDAGPLECVAGHGHEVARLADLRLRLRPQHVRLDLGLARLRLNLRHGVDELLSLLGGGLGGGREGLLLHLPGEGGGVGPQLGGVPLQLLRLAQGLRLGLELHDHGGGGGLRGAAGGAGLGSGLHIERDGLRHVGDAPGRGAARNGVKCGL